MRVSGFWVSFAFESNTGVNCKKEMNEVLNRCWAVHGNSYIPHIVAYFFIAQTLSNCSVLCGKVAKKNKQKTIE